MKRKNIEECIYFLHTDASYVREMYAAMVILDVMNVPLEWISEENLKKISNIVLKNYGTKKFYSQRMVTKLMDIEKEIELEIFNPEELEK